MITSQPLISIIIPCYNVVDYIPATIESLCNLEDANGCEFIFVNDGSTDSTLSYIEDFVNQDARAICINQPNAGVSAARNAALEIANGKYVLMLDGDDCLTSDAIITIKQDIHNADVLLTPITAVEASIQKIFPLLVRDGEYSVLDLYKACAVFPTLPMLVYRTDIIKQHDIRFSSEIHAGEVYTFTCEYLRYCKTIQVTHNSFYLYNIRPSSATHAPNYVKDISVLNAIDTMHQKSNPALHEIPSFTRTLFVLGTSFTYNKYAKFGLFDDQAIKNVKQIFKHPYFSHCIRDIAFSFGHWHRDRILAIYMLTTRIWGYKLLARLMRIKNK